MLWRPPAQTPVPTLAPLVPDGDAVRLSALQASWRRDRWVARRRLALRWLVWIGWRYGLPAMGALAALAIVWRIVLAWPTEVGAKPPAPPPPASSRAPEVIGDWPGEPAVTLRFDPAWSEVQTRPTRHAPASLPAASVPDAANPITPHLKPENWLHSKEP